MVLSCWVQAGEFPFPEIMALAKARVAQARQLASQDAHQYRERWTAAVRGACPAVLDGDDAELDLPCGMRPEVPGSRTQPMPAMLLTHYQHLAYQAPHPGQTQGRLSMHWRFTLVSLGVIWELKVGAAGMQQDLFIAEYERFSHCLSPPPLCFRVNMLRPRRYHHVQITERGQVTHEVHDLMRWGFPMSAFTLGTIYDVQPTAAACGTWCNLYTTAPSQHWQELIGAIEPDATSIQPDDHQVIYAPLLGYQDCGSFPLYSFFRVMTHRDPPQISTVDGPPVALWQFQQQRESGAYNAFLEDTDAPATAGHSRVAAMGQALAAQGFEGPMTQDADMGAAIVRGVPAETQNEAVDWDGYLLQRAHLSGDPEQTALVEAFLGNRVDPVVRATSEMNQISFDPRRHCEAEPSLGQVPLYGAYAWSGDAQGAFRIHDQIVNHPRTSFSHARLLHMKWYWQQLQEIDLYQKAFDYARAALESNINLLAVQQALPGVNQPTPSLASLTGDAPTNNAVTFSESAAMPPFFRSNVRCLDPRQTLQFRLLFGELQGPDELDCHLLWGVAGP